MANVITSVIPQNFLLEAIPSENELMAAAQEALRFFQTTDYARVLGNLVDAQTGKYRGRTYFAGIPKTSKTGSVKNNNDFSGIYIFHNGNEPVYVGISNSIIRRLKYHLFADKSNQSSLVYLLARERYRDENGHQFNGLRDDFPFELYRPGIQQMMMHDWSFQVYTMSNGYHLAFTEIYIASALRTYWNSFDTH